MTDVRLYQTADGGEIDYVNGAPEMSSGLESAAYLSLFGGNERDAGDEATAHLQWWGNFGETMPERTYRSETQHLLRSLPAIPLNLRRVEDAVERDLEWMVGTVVSSVTIAVTMPAPNRFRIALEFAVTDETFAIDFDGRWGSL